MENKIVKVETDTRLAIRENLKTLIRAGKAPNTLKAYSHALGALQKYLNDLPITDANLAAYLSHLHRDGKSPATIAQTVAAVKWSIKNANQDTTQFKITDATLAGIRRHGKDRGRGQVDALNWQDTQRITAFCESDGTKAGLRDSAMIRLMSDCLLRISEVVAVNCDHFTEKTLIIKTSKTDQEGAGENLYITTHTRNIIKQYRSVGAIKDGALFRRIRRGDHIQAERLTADSARRIIKARAKTAGVDGFISGHSLRVGTAVSLAQAGATVVDLQVAGRWKNSQMPAHYAKAQLAERGAVARYKEKQ